MVEERKNVLGLMSGSSLDGLDLALCSFTYQRSPYALLDWRIEAAITIPFPPTWKARLGMATHLPGRELWRLHSDLGHWMGQTAANFLARQTVQAELIGSHGHTVFHDPTFGFTTQIGDGAAIAFRTGLPCVDQLRSADLAAGGEGAPIAPLADRWLFPDYAAFLNLGGIANVSLRAEDQNFLAGDVSGANQILDRLAALEGRPYDEGGKMARNGRQLPELTRQLEALPFHHQPCPKSLGNDWVIEVLWPIIERYPASPADRMYTFCRFLADAIHRVLVDLAGQSELSPQPLRTLVTGGGTHNHFLLECLRQHPQDDQFPLGFEAANSQIADGKEAALVALCALHRYLGVPNALASATGATVDTVNGALYLPAP